jgi:hypothetical protein
MPKKRFPLGFGKAPSLEISWSGGWFRVINNIAVKYDGAVVGSFPSRFDLEKGQEIQLPDGGLLNIRLVVNHFEIFYNQQSVQEITNAIGLRNFSFVFGALLFLYGIWDFFQAGILWEAIIHCGVGLGFVVCGLIVEKHYSWSTWASIFLSMMYTAIFRIVVPIASGEYPSIVPMLVLLIVVLFVFPVIFAKYFRTAKPS